MHIERISIRPLLIYCFSDWLMSFIFSLYSFSSFLLLMLLLSAHTLFTRIFLTHICNFISMFVTFIHICICMHVFLTFCMFNGAAVAPVSPHCGSITELNYENNWLCVLWTVGGSAAPPNTAWGKSIRIGRKRSESELLHTTYTSHFTR